MIEPVVVCPPARRRQRVCVCGRPPEVEQTLDQMLLVAMSMLVGYICGRPERWRHVSEMRVGSKGPPLLSFTRFDVCPSARETRQGDELT